MIRIQAKRSFGVLIAGSLLAGSFLASASRAQTPGRTSSDAGTVVAGKTMASDLVPGANQPNTVSGTNVDLRALKSQFEAFESFLDRDIQQNFAQPFALLQDAKGIYLPGYGVAFHLEVNLHPMQMAMPFDFAVLTPEQIKKGKADKLLRIGQLKSRLSQLLLEHGDMLSAVAPEQNIAVVVHLFNLPSEGRDLPTQVVITVNRQMLLDYRNRRLTAEQFQQTGSVIEF